MSETIEEIQMEAEDGMQKAISHLENELVKIRAGKASPLILDGIMVNYYDNPTPIGQVANINVLDARTLSIQPFEKAMLQEIDKAIMAANIGITPQNDGTNIRLFMPPLTEDRRKELAKNVFAEGEHAKISIRNIRRDAMEGIKKMQKDGLSEDAAKGSEKDIQIVTDTAISKVDSICQAKEKELLTV
jgi:ribosome recycling factor